MLSFWGGGGKCTRAGWGARVTGCGTSAKSTVKLRQEVLAEKEQEPKKEGQGNTTTNYAVGRKGERTREEKEVEEDDEEEDDRREEK